MIRKTDRNHSEIIKQCRKVPGISVFSTHILGKGFPDIVIGYKGLNYLIEIKDGDKPPSQRVLTIDEKEFHKNWKGQVNICHNIDEVFTVLEIK